MNYATIKYFDIANGPGVGVSLFVSGCPIHCPGCFNKEAWDFNYGHTYTSKTTDEIVKFFNTLKIFFSSVGAIFFLSSHHAIAL